LSLTREKRGRITLLGGEGKGGTRGNKRAPPCLKKINNGFTSDSWKRRGGEGIAISPTDIIPGKGGSSGQEAIVALSKRGEITLGGGKRAVRCSPRG